MKLKVDDSESVRLFIEYIKKITSEKIKGTSNVYVLVKNENGTSTYYDSRKDKVSKIQLSDKCCVYLMNNDTILNTGQINTMPSCCGMVIMHNARAGYSMERKGFGRIGNFLRRFICWNCNYTIVIAQDKLPSHNISILENSGWELTREFKNKNSSNQVRMYSYNLRLFDEIDFKHLI